MTTKLSKEALKIKNLKSREEILDAIEKKNIPSWLGLGENPYLDEELIHIIFKYLKDDNVEYKTRTEAARTKRAKLRNAIRSKIIKTVPVSEGMLRAFFVSKNGWRSALHNPSLTVDIIRDLFKATYQNNNFKFIHFTDFLKELGSEDNTNNKFLTVELQHEIYEFAKKYSLDWSFKNNVWYSVIDAFLNLKNCSYEIILDIVTSGDPNSDWAKRFFSRISYNDSTDENILSILYERTGDNKYLPDTVKETFLF